MSFTKLTPEGFAALTIGEQRQYQVDEAQDIFNRAISQDPSVTQADKDFAGRILGKVIPEGPVPTGLGNVAQTIQDLKDSVAIGSWQVLLPYIIIAVAIGLLIWVIKKQ